MIARDTYLNDLINFKDTNLIKVITGIRRCGKSTLFELFRDWLLAHGVGKEQIVFINIEDGDNRGLRTAAALYEHVNARLLPGSKNYVFLDEIQQVADFEQAADWLYARKNVDLYLTGSNAFLLSGELATLLSGRYVEIKMLPLSFREYVSAFPNGDRSRLFRDYLQNGSFPGTLELKRAQDVRVYLEGLYNTILIRDVTTRCGIGSPAMLESIAEYLFDNVGNITSSSKIAGAMTSAGRKISVPTVESYLKALSASFMFYKAERYDVKGKQRLASGFKYYAADVGLRAFLLGASRADTGHVIENVVFLELLRRGCKVFTGKAGAAEVDFVAEGEGGTRYYQVALSVLDEQTLHRELAPLQSIADHNPKFLLTMDYLPETSYNGIRHVNLIDWLLADNSLKFFYETS